MIHQAFPTTPLAINTCVHKHWSPRGFLFCTLHSPSSLFHVPICRRPFSLGLGALQGAAPAACTALSTLPVLFHLRVFCCSHCHIRVQNKTSLLTLLCVWHCDDCVAGNLSHSVCTCENPSLYMLAFIRIAFLRKPVDYQGEATVLWVQRPIIHAELHHFLTFFASGSTKLQWSPLSHPFHHHLEPFPSFHVTPETSWYFRNISLLFSETYLREYAKETVHKPNRCIM